MWGVKPNHVPWSVSVIMICWDVVPDILKVFAIATGLEGIIVDLQDLIEFVGVIRQASDSY